MYRLTIDADDPDLLMAIIRSIKVLNTSVKMLTFQEVKDE